MHVQRNDLLGADVEFIQMTGRRIFRFVASHSEKGDIHLEGRIPQKAQKLDLRVHGGGHEIYNPHFEGTYVLMFGAVFGHDKNTLFSEGVVGG
jgi:hypothetical protein